MSRRVLLLFLSLSVCAPVVAAREGCCCERPASMQAISDACCEPASACLMADPRCAEALENTAAPALPSVSSGGFTQVLARGPYARPFSPPLNHVVLVLVRSLSPPSKFSLRSLPLRL